MTYEMTCIEYENYLLKNRKDLTLQTIEYYLSDNSSDDDDDDLELLKLQKFIKQELKIKNKLTKKRLPKKKKTLNVIWDKSSTSEDEKKTNKGEVTNYALTTFDEGNQNRLNLFQNYMMLFISYF